MMKKNIQILLTVIMISMVAIAGCQRKQIKDTADDKGPDTIKITGYGFARIRPPAMAKQKLTARQKARRLASACLAAHMSGAQFRYSKTKKPRAIVKTYETNYQGTIKMPDTEYYYLTGNRVLVKQTTSIKMPRSNRKEGLIYKTSFRTADFQKSFPAIYRSAIETVISRKYPAWKKVTGKIYLSHLEILDYKGKEDMKVNAELFIVVF